MYDYLMIAGVCVIYIEAFTWLTRCIDDAIQFHSSSNPPWLYLVLPGLVGMMYFMEGFPLFSSAYNGGELEDYAAALAHDLQVITVILLGGMFIFYVYLASLISQQEK